MIALAGAALCLGACQQNGKTEVTLKMKDGQKAPKAILSFDLSDTLSTRQDSLTFITEAADTLIGVINLGEGNYWPVVLDGQPLEIDFSGESPVVVKGSEVNKRIMEAKNESARIENILMTITDPEFKDLVEKYNNNIPDSLLRSLQARYNKAIEEFKACLNKHIEANKDNVFASRRAAVCCLLSLKSLSWKSIHTRTSAFWLPCMQKSKARRTRPKVLPLWISR